MKDKSLVENNNKMKKPKDKDDVEIMVSTL